MSLKPFVVLAAAALPAFAPAAAHAQSTVGPTAKSGWSENCGWINFRDAGSPAATQGVRLLSTHLRGYAWGENIGYINLGQGPANGVAYANPTSGSVPGTPDFGVNRDPASNLLSGYAWSENAGWINFGAGAAATPPSPARYDPATFRLRGAAWAENVGWINFDTTNTAVSFCRADFDGNGVRDVADIFAFLSAWFATDARADYDFTGGVNVADIFVFLSIWFAGC